VMKIRSILVLSVLLSASAWTQPVDSLFIHGQEAYRSGAFDEAVRAYRAIVDGGHVSAPIYYNLGNAYFRAGNLSQSILSYERALQLDPTDGDIQHNLDLVRLRTSDRIDPLPELFLITWIRSLNATLPVTLSAFLFLAGWVVLFLSLAMMYVVRSSSVVRTMRFTFFGGAVLALIAGVVLALQVLVIPSSDEGIIMSPTVTAKSSPDAASVDAFVVHEGLKVLLGDEVDGWRRITLADGKTAWIQSQQVEPI